MSSRPPTVHSERWHTSKYIRFALIIACLSVASAINPTGTAIEVNS